MTRNRTSLLLTGCMVLIATGCATGTDSAFGATEGDGSGGYGGAGGAGGANGMSASSATGSTSATSSASGTSSSSTSASATSSGTSGAGGGPVCGADQHLCGGICAGNTPQTGCFNSASCAPCAAPPINATANCTASGDCDFMCNSGYQKSGNTCVCAAECCTNADCGGGTCQGGTCSDPPCDQFACTLQCIGMGCFGLCAGTDCQCIC